VVVAVYLAEGEEYFASYGPVLEACLNSIRRTTGEETGVTVVVNGASPKVKDYIHRVVGAEEWADVIWKRRNVGKVEALFSALRGYHEPFVTLCDCDVLFRPGWLDRTMEVFEKIPYVGAVSALPVPHLRRQHTSSTYVGAALRGLLRIGSYCSAADLKQYMLDLQSHGLISAGLFSRHPAIVQGGTAVPVGCTHMQCTYRREALHPAPKEPCTDAMGRESERLWMDRPPDVAGWWKVSLPEAYVRHMGNVLPENISEEWMAHAKPVRCEPPRGRRPLEARLPYSVRDIAGRIIQRLVEARLRRSSI
jgi:hypothetical protein